MKRIFLIVIGLAIAVSLSFAYSGGPLDGYCGNPPANNNCTACHNSYPVNSGDGEIGLDGPLTYTPGDTLHYIFVYMNDPGQNRWGFELTPMVGNNAAGTLIVYDPTNTQLSENPSPSPDFLKQTSAGTYAGSNNCWGWAFDWIAPPAGTGTVYFYIVGNAANNSNSPAGDYIYTSIHTMTEEGSAVSPQISIPLSPQILSNYPNPFNPITTLTFSLNQPEPISLNLYDVMGRQVMSLYQGNISAGSHQFTIDGSTLASGIYFARMVTPNSSSVRVLNLVK